MADLTKFEGNLKRLRGNIEAVQSTFDKYGLEISSTGASFADCLGGPAAEFFIEIIEKEKKSNDKVYIKVNVYDENNQLIGSSASLSALDLGKFSGFDTYEVTVISSSMWQEAYKAKVYLANSR